MFSWLARSALGEAVAPVEPTRKFWSALFAGDDAAATLILENDCGTAEAKGEELRKLAAAQESRLQRWGEGRDSVDCWSPDARSGLCPVHVVAARGLLRTIDALAARGVNVNQRGPADNTPLHMAAHHGQAAAAARLLVLGADVALRNAQHKRPVDVASAA
ncbi:unnamed protein product, partial [Phaeothamnion confervicola]